MYCTYSLYCRAGAEGRGQGQLGKSGPRDEARVTHRVVRAGSPGHPCTQPGVPRALGRFSQGQWGYREQQGLKSNPGQVVTSGTQRPPSHRRNPASPCLQGHTERLPREPQGPPSTDPSPAPGLGAGGGGEAALFPSLPSPLPHLRGGSFGYGLGVGVGRKSSHCHPLSLTLHFPRR